MASRHKTVYRDTASNRLIPKKVAMLRDPETWIEEQYDQDGSQPFATRSSLADGTKVWYRSKRIFHTDIGWYVGTREGNLGPFPDRKLAVMESRHHIKELQQQKAVLRD